MIAQEVAEQEFDRFAEAMDIETDVTQMTEETEEMFTASRNKFIKAIVKGKLVVNENGEPVYTPVRSSNTSPITFKEPDGAALITNSRGRKKADDGVGQMYQIMGSMTGTGAGRFANMKLVESQDCMAIASLFIAQ